MKKTKDQRPGWDEYFIEIAALVSKRSTCLRRKVGAVLVKNNKIIGEGAHIKFGGPHAEINAIQNAKSSPKEATLYISLEPCAHFGKTPPCVDAILENKIRKVVVGAKDPNPFVRGKGIRILKKRGIEVISGVLEKEATELNRDFNYWIQKKIPYVVVKAAQSLDGKIATLAGQPRWITGDPARKFSHILRAQSDAVLVGVNTILKDKPRLNVRGVSDAGAPTKIILDSRLRTPVNARIFSKQSAGRVILAVTRKAPQTRVRLFRKNAQVLVINEKKGKVDLVLLLKILGKMGIIHILIEGGGETINSALSAKLVNEAYFFIAPKIVGRKDALDATSGANLVFLKQAAYLRRWTAGYVGNDLLIRGIL